MSHECPTGITNMAHKRWLASKPKHQQYFGNSHTSPGLVISNAIAIHINDAETKKLPPAPDRAPPAPPTATTTTAPHDPEYDPIDNLLDVPVPDPTETTLAELFQCGFHSRYDTSQRSSHLSAVPSPIATTLCPPTEHNTRSRNNP